MHIVDLSSNGTKVKSQRIPKGIFIEIKAGDAIKFGREPKPDAVGDQGPTVFRLEGPPRDGSFAAEDAKAADGDTPAAFGRFLFLENCRTSANILKDHLENDPYDEQYSSGQPSPFS